VAVPQAKINDRLIEIRDGETILEAARRTGIEIPTLCYSEGISPEGGCRLCLVETNRSSRPVGACHTLIQPGMEIATHTPRIESLRYAILSLYLESDGPTAFQGDGRESEFTRLLARYGLPIPAHGPEGNGARIDESHTYLRFNPRLCINCRRCLNACEQIQGQFVYGMADRGPKPISSLDLANTSLKAPAWPVGPVWTVARPWPSVTATACRPRLPSKSRNPFAVTAGSAVASRSSPPVAGCSASRAWRTPPSIAGTFA